MHLQFAARLSAQLAGVMVTCTHRCFYILKTVLKPFLITPRTYFGIVQRRVFQKVRIKCAPSITSSVIGRMERTKAISFSWACSLLTIAGEKRSFRTLLRRFLNRRLRYLVFLPQLHAAVHVIPHSNFTGVHHRTALPDHSCTERAASGVKTQRQMLGITCCFVQQLDRKSRRFTFALPRFRSSLAIAGSHGISGVPSRART